MKNRVFLTAIFIAVLATSVTFVSPSTATPYSSPAATTSPQRENAPIGLTIPTNNVTYEVNGTFYAWVNVTSFEIFVNATNLPGFSSVNITVPEFYIGIRISVGAKNVTFSINSTDPTKSYVQGTVDVNVQVTGRAKVYFNVTSGPPTFDSSFTNTASGSWTGKWFIPWGTTKNFTMPFPFFDLDPSAPNATTADADAGIKFTNANLTSSDTSWTVTHTQWDFSAWLRNKVNSTLNGLAGEAMQQILAAGIPGISMGFTVPTSVGMVDLWKANATTPDTEIPNVLLMASGLINLLVRYYLVGHGTFSGNIGGTIASVTYDINVGADFGMFFSLIVASDLGHQVLNNYEINTFLVQVPENATLTWRKIGVIVYYGSPAHDCDVTGGESQGYWSYPDGEHKLFFVDYGWDGTPDFATNGSAQVAIGHPTATITGTTFPFTVQLDKSASGWIYFSLQLPSGTSESDITVKRTDGATTTTVNSTQYWIDPNSHILYVCDDPTYRYTVELIGGAGTSLLTMMVLAGAIAVVVFAVALVVLKRRGAKPTNVSIK
nr:hypothetical protein [Candidatus Njordarchaeota archaeon]